MKVTFRTEYPKRDTIITIQSVIIEDNIILQFTNENDSISTFKVLKDLGIKCCHAGVNSPYGSSIWVYNNNNAKITIQ